MILVLYSNRNSSNSNSNSSSSSSSSSTRNSNGHKRVQFPHQQFSIFPTITKKEEESDEAADEEEEGEIIKGATTTMVLLEIESNQISILGGSLTKHLASTPSLYCTVHHLIFVRSWKCVCYILYCHHQSRTRYWKILLHVFFSIPYSS